MQIDLRGNGIFLSQNGELKPYQKNQLTYWGFRKDNDTYAASSGQPGVLLTKLLGYFDAEKIDYSLTDECKRAVNAIKDVRDNFEAIKLMGKEYKDGHLPKEATANFAAFLKKTLVRPLKPHQVKAAGHLYLIKNGANFSVPGSGKTAVVLSAYEKLRIEGKVNTLLVVGPPSCFGPWRDEFKITLGREPEFKILAGGNPTTRKSAYFQDKSKKPELYLVTFQTLLQDHHDAAVFMQRNGVEIFLVVDEAHYIKRIDGNWAKVVLDLSKYAKFRCILTGTPMPRSYTDIFNLFDFLWPENNPIDLNGKIKIQQLEESRENAEVRAILRQDIGPLFYRVRKSDLGLRPAIFHDPIVLKMNKNEKRLYDAIENRIIEYSKEDHLKNAEFVKKLRRGRIMRLRQSVSYTKLLSTAIEDYGEELIEDRSNLTDIIHNYDDLEVPAKIEYLLSLVKDMQREKRKVIVWSNFVNTLELIRSIFAKNGIYSKKIEGKTPIEQDSIEEEETREKIRKEFLDPTSGLDVLIANPAACAESISLHTTCHAAVYYDLSYNCAQYLQSLDRIHRVGGSEAVDTHYYFLQYENTIDQDVLKNLRDKAEKMNSVIEDDYGIYNLDMGEGDEDEEAFARIFNNKGQ